MHSRFDGVAVKRGVSVFMGTFSSVPKQSRSDPLLCISPESPLSRHLSQSIVESIEEGQGSKGKSGENQPESDPLASMLTSLSSQMENQNAESLYRNLQQLAQCLESCDYKVRFAFPLPSRFPLPSPILASLSPSATSFTAISPVRTPRFSPRSFWASTSTSAHSSATRRSSCTFFPSSPS